MTTSALFSFPPITTIAHLTALLAGFLLAVPLALPFLSDELKSNQD